jgi:hypothetical protein
MCFGSSDSSLERATALAAGGRSAGFGGSFGSSDGSSGSNSSHFPGTRCGRSGSSGNSNGKQQLWQWSCSCHSTSTNMIIIPILPVSSRLMYRCCWLV